MADVEEVIRGTVFVGRKISDNKFGSYEFGLHFPVEFKQDAAAVEQTDAVVAAFEAARELVAQQSAPIVAELVKDDFKPKQSKGQRSISKELREGQVLRECKGECGEETPHWDNRENKKSSRSPDFKCTVCGAAEWLNSKK